MNKSVKFATGDVVWVPSSLAAHTKSKLWPAKFLKQTNRADICMVVLYGSKINQADEQFLVDTEEIIAFDQHEIVNPDSNIKYAYEQALKDYNQKNSKPIQQPLITTSAQLCEFVENLLQAELLETNQQIKQSQVQVPKFAKKDPPLKPEDLKVYFRRMTPQVICFLLQSKPGMQQSLKSFLEQVKNKIVKEISAVLTKNSMDFST